MVVSDTWDREKFATAMKEAREQEALMNSAKKEIGTLTKKREYAAALAKIDEYVEKTKSAEAKLSLLDVKLQLHQLAKSKLDDVKATYEKMFEVAQVDPFLAYQTAMNVFELNEQGKIDSKQILRGARDLAKNVAAQQEGNTKALLLESFARLEYALGNNEGALKIQEEAMSVADAKGKEQLQEFLDELKARVSKEKR